MYKEINIEVDNFKINAFAVSESNDTEHHQPYNMVEFYLLDDENRFGVLEYKNKKYDAFVNIGQWGYETRLKDTHITLGASKLHDFCLQIELSQAVSDDKYVYIIKNISNMAGAGAICRLYRGLKNNKEEKLKWQQLFIELYGNDIIKYKNKDWIVISKIKKDNLYNNDKTDEIFYDLIYNMFFAMLLVENISKKSGN